MDLDSLPALETDLVCAEDFSLLVTDSGALDLIGFWFRLELQPGVWVDTDKSPWRQAGFTHRDRKPLLTGALIEVRVSVSYSYGVECSVLLGHDANPGI